MNPKVAATFRNLYVGKRTGALMSEASEAKRGIFFDAGGIVRAQSSRIVDRLGEVMMRHGRITKEQFDDASHFIKSGRRFGEILVELKLVEKEEIERFVRLQLLDIASSVLIEPPRRLTFSNLSEVEGVLLPPVSVADVLMEAARRTPDIEERLEHLRGDDRRLGFSSDPMLRFQEIHLEPEEAFVLSRVNGSDRAKDIFALSPLSEERTARTLVGLLEAGIIEPEGEATPRPVEPRGASSNVGPGRQETGADPKDPARSEVEALFDLFQSKDHWEVLGLERGAAIEEIRQAFHDKAPRYHPDRFRRIEDPGFQEKVSYVFRRVSDAYTTLSKEATAEDYAKLVEMEKLYDEQKKKPAGPETSYLAALSRSRHPQEAKALYARAKKAYGAGDYWSAIQLSQQAIELASDQAEYYHLLALALAQNPKWLHDAERNLKIAINLDPWKSQYLVSLGNMYKKAGMDTRASRAFEQAKAIDPTVSFPTIET